MGLVEEEMRFKVIKGLFGAALQVLSTFDAAGVASASTMRRRQ